MSSSKPFSVNTTRFDPDKTFRFLVYFGTVETPVAGMNKVGAIKRDSDVIDYKEGGNAMIRKGLGRTKYDPITLERGVTHDPDFKDWADAAQELDQGSPVTSLAKLCAISASCCQRRRPAGPSLHRPSTGFPSTRR